MEYRFLGRSDIEVSALCLGSMTWGEQSSEQESFAQIDRAKAAGINFLDTAEMYPVPPKPDTYYASAEAIIGNISRPGATAATGYWPARLPGPAMVWNISAMANCALPGPT